MGIEFTTTWNTTPQQKRLKHHVRLGLKRVAGVDLSQVKANEKQKPVPVPKELKDMGAKIAPTIFNFEEIKSYWVELFPEKPKPRASKSITGKIKTRMKEPHFRDNWRAAMLRASRSNYLGLKETTWFDLNWFLQNDSNYEKCLNGKYDVKPGTQRKITFDPETSAMGQELIDRINNGE